MPILVTVPKCRRSAAIHPVDEYVARLGAALPGPRRRKADLVAEARDSLIDASEALKARGYDRGTAERIAVADFGDLDEVVPGYRTELGFVQGRRTAVLLVSVMLAQPIVWLEGTWPWNQDVDESAPSAVQPLLDRFVELSGLVVIIASIIAVAALGIGVRSQLVRGQVVRTTAFVALASCLLIGGGSIGLAVVGAHSAGEAITGILWIGLFVLTPLTAVGLSAGRCLRLA
jgi:hypothetical protein